MSTPPLVPAATVVLLRDAPGGLETLLVRRNATLEFAGGMWVFPGGRIDPVDFDPPLAHHTGPIDTETIDPEVMVAAARRAARREAQEESGLELSDDAELVWFSHWTPPEISPKRFATWFFAARAPAGEVTIDGGEIHDHCWMTPSDAHRRRDALEIELAPPTWITLNRLAQHSTVDGLLEALAIGAPARFATRFAAVDGGAVLLYAGDAGYETVDPAAQGGRHRLWMLDSGWRYETDGEPASTTDS